MKMKTLTFLVALFSINAYAQVDTTYCERFLYNDPDVLYVDYFDPDHGKFVFDTELWVKDQKILQQQGDGDRRKIIQDGNRKSFYSKDIGLHASYTTDKKGFLKTVDNFGLNHIKVTFEYRDNRCVPMKLEFPDGDQTPINASLCHDLMKPLLKKSANNQCGLDRDSVNRAFERHGFKTIDTLSFDEIETLEKVIDKHAPARAKTYLQECLRRDGIRDAMMDDSLWTTSEASSANSSPSATQK